MVESEILKYLQQTFPIENEKCEWKEFKSLKNAVAGRKGDDVISYVSAIANRDGGHLILGVEDATLNVVGIQDFADYTAENIIYRINGNCSNLSDVGLVVEELKATDTGKIVWILHIPKHSARKPVYAHKTAWQRIGDSLTSLTEERERTILNEPLFKSVDWSAGVCEYATVDDLSGEAILLARTNYKSKYPELGEEVEKWDDLTFLNKAKITLKGKITRTAILLLGKAESEHLISPSEAKIRWILKDHLGNEKDYQIFEPPFLLTIDQVYAKIRNLKYRYIKDASLFPEEVLKYEPYTIRESLNNCIAHQDYEMGGRVNVVEFDDRLVFSNLGSFIPGSIESVIRTNAPEEQYRNPFLVTAMFNLKMVDTIGSGIRKMFNFQRQRLFPLPDFDLQNDRVVVTIIGEVLDLDYARVLSRHPELTLEEIILLDKVQKKQASQLSEEEIAHLRKKKLIEGRKPNFIIAEQIALQTNQISSYLKNRGFDNEYYKKLLLEFIGRQKEGASKSDISALLWDKLPDVLTDKQKRTKLSTLLTELKREKRIINVGSDTKSCWKSTN